MTKIETRQQGFNQLATGDVSKANPLKYRLNSNSMAKMEDATKLADGLCRNADMNVLGRKLSKDNTNTGFNRGFIKGKDITDNR